MVAVFFFKQKTAYELRISDWSSDVCSSDLGAECVTTPSMTNADAGAARIDCHLAADVDDRKAAFGVFGFRQQQIAETDARRSPAIDALHRRRLGRKSVG